MTQELTSYHKLVKSLSKQEILDQFIDVIPLERTTGEKSSSNSVPAGNVKVSGADAASSLFAGHDEEQIRLMAENCIVLDYDDVPIGSGTKKLCHIMKNINQGLLHRAFSVFLFDSQDRLLLQQRADEKITFPSLWTNTCCSHPLCVPSELGFSSSSADGSNIHSLNTAVRGVKSAAQRKLDHELGISSSDVPIEDFNFLTRIHYMAPSNGVWGEHEIDYILIIRSDGKVHANPNEVKDYKYVTKEELKEMFERDDLSFTPWFKLICESYLFNWWNHLDNIDTYTSTTIDRML
ncbi:DEKNAAC103261 [Brettanomyces naardenensis]|uniref:Isopentenyl-diphosphate Delta-isomerase n=1 Tax=Brettanomyces naardenensis TaxID=13370 RepID=A0A448YMX0_BRENA|nr:DEKNAAC103261 [Brettanomyces naardenensis]